jgi:hypothetical protein
MHENPAVLNGRSVLTAFERVLGGRLRPTGSVVQDGGVTTTPLPRRDRGGEAIGWSTNLQSSFGVTKTLRARLAAAVQSLAE